jgi:predicted GNAT superfamily acetyltransferase
VEIRELADTDIDFVLELNNANVPAVSGLDRRDLDALLQDAAWSLVAVEASEVIGFSISLLPGSAYASVNYRWFVERYESFVYLDRIAVTEARRGEGVGEHLYADLIRRIGASAPLLTCEVNVNPPNEGSMRFHQRLGFREVGRQDTPYGIRVGMLALDLGRHGEAPADLVQQS